MRAQEYKTVFVTDLGTVQQAVAITKITDRVRRRRSKIVPAVFHSEATR
jgi:hypothetical protein